MKGFKPFGFKSSADSKFSGAAITKGEASRLESMKTSPKAVFGGAITKGEADKLAGFAKGGKVSKPRPAGVPFGKPKFEKVPDAAAKGKSPTAIRTGEGKAVKPKGLKPTGPKFATGGKVQAPMRTETIGDQGNAVVKRTKPITAFDASDGGKGPLRTGYAKGGKIPAGKMALRKGKAGC